IEISDGYQQCTPSENLARMHPGRFHQEATESRTFVGTTTTSSTSSTTTVSSTVTTVTSPAGVAVFPQPDLDQMFDSTDEGHLKWQDFTKGNDPGVNEFSLDRWQAYWYERNPPNDYYGPTFYLMQRRYKLNAQRTIHLNADWDNTMNTWLKGTGQKLDASKKPKLLTDEDDDWDEVMTRYEWETIAHRKAFSDAGVPIIPKDHSHSILTKEAVTAL
ncbi:unnamed protein product, partial [Amoebophrya sp. A120]